MKKSLEEKISYNEGILQGIAFALSSARKSGDKNDVMVDLFNKREKIKTHTLYLKVKKFKNK